MIIKDEKCYVIKQENPIGIVKVITPQVIHALMCTTGSDAVIGFTSESDAITMLAMYIMDTYPLRADEGEWEMRTLAVLDDEIKLRKTMIGNHGDPLEPIRKRKRMLMQILQDGRTSVYGNIYEVVEMPIASLYEKIDSDYDGTWYLYHNKKFIIVG